MSLTLSLPIDKPIDPTLRQTAERLLSLRPSFSVEGWRNTQFRSNQALLEAEMGALWAAGLP